MLILYILLFAGALCLCIFGGNIFVDSATKFAKKLRIPLIIIGATIVSVATTLPELIVSIVSSSQGSFTLAVGNAVGSVICNTALITGLSIAFLPVIMKEKTSIAKYLILLTSLVLLIIFGFSVSGNYAITKFEAIIFFLLFIAFMVTSILDAKRQQKLEDNENSEANNTQDTNIETNIVTDKWWKIIIFFILGAATIALGATLMVESAKKIAYIMHISEAFVGLTIVAIGTSLPELVTTIIAIRKKTSELGYGNIIGANILNATLLIGSAGMIAWNSGLAISKWTYILSIPLALILNLIFVLPLIIKNRSYRWQGIVLLTLYVGYVAFLIIMSSMGLSV